MAIFLPKTRERDYKIADTMMRESALLSEPACREKIGADAVVASDIIDAIGYSNQF